MIILKRLLKFFLLVFLVVFVFISAVAAANSNANFLEKKGNINKSFSLRMKGKTDLTSYKIAVALYEGEVNVATADHIWK